VLGEAGRAVCDSAVSVGYGVTFEGSGVSTARGRAEYRLYLQSWGWRRRRNRAVRRAGFRCEDCGRRVALQVHHLTYLHRGRERRRELVALCRHCHNVRHGARF
jgi:hypothetical protein